MHSKKIIVITLVLISLVSLAGCDLAFERYSNKKYGFSLLLPRMWHVEEDAYNTAVTSISQETGADDLFQENINVVVTDLPEEMPLDVFFDMNKKEALTVIPGEKFDISQGDISAGWDKGKWLFFNGVMKDTTITTYSAVFMKGKRTYAVTCTGEYRQYPKYESTFKKAISSFRID